MKRYTHLTDLSHIDTPSYAAVAKNIRRDLKHHFPSMKVSVTTKPHAVAVDWQDGATKAEVNNLLNKFNKAEFNGSDDCHDFQYSEFIDTYGGVMLIVTSRSYSDEAIEQGIATKQHEFKQTLTVEEYRNGDLFLTFNDSLQDSNAQECIRDELASTNYLQAKPVLTTNIHGDNKHYLVKTTVIHGEHPETNVTLIKAVSRDIAKDGGILLASGHELEWNEYGAIDTRNDLAYKHHECTEVPPSEVAVLSKYHHCHLVKQCELEAHTSWVARNKVDSLPVKDINKVELEPIQTFTRRGDEPLFTVALATPVTTSVGKLLTTIADSYRKEFTIYNNKGGIVAFQFACKRHAEAFAFRVMNPDTPVITTRAQFDEAQAEVEDISINDLSGAEHVTIELARLDAAMIGSPFWGTYE